MIKKWARPDFLLYAVFAFSLMLFISSRIKSNREEITNKIPLRLRTFHTSSGWGYDIFTNDTLFIHQTSIPAVAGTNGFVSESEAKQIGNLVMYKMQTHHLPYIRLAELDSCGISR